MKTIGNQLEKKLRSTQTQYETNMAILRMTNSIISRIFVLTPGNPYLLLLISAFDRYYLPSKTLFFYYLTHLCRFI